MAYSKTTVAKAEKLRRVRVPRFETTKEWRMMKEDIDKGMKPSELLVVIFTKDEMDKYRITNRRTVARYVKNYISARKLPYMVKSFERKETGDFVVQVWGRKIPRAD